MSAATQLTNRNQREEVSFPPNVPVTVTMKFPQPKLVSGQYGERYLFTTCQDTVFFLDPDVAAQIADLGINVREPFTITKVTSGKKAEPVTWRVAKLGPNGALVIPRETPEPAPVPASGSAERPAAPKPPGRAGALIEEANVLVDAYAEVLARALRTYEGRIKPDEVRALLISTYIKRTREAA